MGAGGRSAAPERQDARNERLTTSDWEPTKAKPFNPNLRSQFYSTENSEEPLTGKTSPGRPPHHFLYRSSPGKSNLVRPNPTKSDHPRPPPPLHSEAIARLPVAYKQRSMSHICAHNG